SRRLPRRLSSASRRAHAEELVRVRRDQLRERAQALVGAAVNWFVSGGSRGIGRGIVLRAVEEGHDVAFSYTQAREQAEEVVQAAKAIDARRACRAYQLDVRDSARVDAVAEQVLADFASIEVMVANAGIHRNNLAVHIDN